MWFYQHFCVNKYLGICQNYVVFALFSSLLHQNPAKTCEKHGKGDFVKHPYAGGNIQQKALAVHAPSVEDQSCKWGSYKFP